jgi:hypothetical protein
MGFFSKLLGETASAPISAIGDIIDDIHTSKEEKLEAEQILYKIESKLQNAQAEITKSESQHRTVFVAGWRPFIGWICGTGIAINFVVAPLLSPFYAIQTTDPDSLFTLALAMMGVAGLRTVEKARGLTR